MDPTNRSGLPSSSLGVLVRLELLPEQQAEFERLRAASVEIAKILKRLDKYQKNLLRRLGVSTDLENTEEFWVQLRAAARFMGVLDEEFWNSTPRELCALLEHRATELDLLRGRTRTEGSVSDPRPQARATVKPQPTGTNGDDVRTRSAEFPKRASWLKDRLLERGWSNSDPSKYRGPDRKTIEKVLRGERVRNDVIEKLAEALSSKPPKVSALDIPQD